MVTEIKDENIEPDVEPENEPDVEPENEPDVEPENEPDVEPDVEPENEPEVKPKARPRRMTPAEKKSWRRQHAREKAEAENSDEDLEE